MHLPKLSSLLTASIAAAMVPIAPPVFAQGALEEIVVTARKREESLQDVPLSITAIPGAKMEEYGITSVVDVAAVTPGLHITDGPLSVNLSVRGITSGGNQGFEQSVTTYLDGAYVSRGFWLKSGLFDMESVELLKGPQGTYFGKNAIAGAINMRSRNPSEEFEASVGVGYEIEAEEMFVEGTVSGPLSDTLSARAALRYGDSDGWMENLATGINGPAKEELLGRVTFVWDAADDVSVNLKVDYSDFERLGSAYEISSCSEFVGFGPGGAITAEGGSTLNGALGVPMSAGVSVDDCVLNGKTSNRNLAGITELNNLRFGPPGTPPVPFNIAVPVDQQRDPQDEWSAYAITGTVDWQLNDNWTLTSLTSYRDQDYSSIISCDFNDLPVCNVNRTDIVTSLQQELRVSSDPSARLRGLGGVFYEDGELEVLSEANVMALFPGSRYAPGTQDSKTWAIFAEMEYDITESLNLALGGRYTDEEKDGTLDNCLGALFGDGSTFCDDRTDSPFPASFFFEFPEALSDTFKDTNFSPSITLSWDATDDDMYYIRYAEGFKAGGFDLEASTPSTFDNFGFDSEEVDTVEIGAKYTGLDGRFQLNAALFRSEYTNLQVQTFTGGVSFTVQNAGVAESQGLEFESLLQVTDQLQVGLSGTFLDATIDDFTEAQCAPFETPTPGSRSCDQSGNDLAFSPDYTFNLFASYSMPLASGWGLSLGADLFLSDSYENGVSNDPVAAQDNYHLLNLNAALVDESGAWNLSVFARNVTDEIVKTTDGAAPLMGTGDRYSAVLQTRAVGFAAKYNF